MKIGIMTFWWSDDNYGQILQCYALQKYLRDAGHDAYLIRYDPRNDYGFLNQVLRAFHPVRLIKFLYKIISSSKNSSLNAQREFAEFRGKFIKQTDEIYFSYKALVERPPEADVYIVGSDQVWGSFGASSVSRVVNLVNAYGLNFGTESIKRIAYAVSFGRKRVPNDFMERYTSFLKKFSYFSVREKSGLNICRQCDIVAEWVPDPTMLIDIDVYKSFYKTELVIKPGNPYVLLYILGNESNFPIASIFEWAKSININVVYITGNRRHDKYTKVYATIPQWLFLVDNARYVITNSYHCAVFALIFQRPFYIIPLTGKDVEMNDRFDSLFELFDLPSRFINDINLAEDDINWDKVQTKTNKIKASCKLTSILQ
jgi:hypothetical protein